MFQPLRSALLNEMPEMLISPLCFGFCGAALWQLLALACAKIPFSFPNSWWYVFQRVGRALVFPLINEMEQGRQGLPQLGREVKTRKGLVRTPLTELFAGSGMLWASCFGNITRRPQEGQCWDARLERLIFLLLRCPLQVTGIQGTWQYSSYKLTHEPQIAWHQENYYYGRATEMFQSMVLCVAWPCLNCCASALAHPSFFLPKEGSTAWVASPVQP